jgi:hypothetical protein
MFFAISSSSSSFLSCSIIQVVACMYVSITYLHGQTYTTGFKSMKMMMMMMMRRTTNQRFYLSSTYHISHENFKCVLIWNGKTQVDLRRKKKGDEDASSCQEAIRSLFLSPFG